jgi:PAS domain S-box-containing protein
MYRDVVSESRFDEMKRYVRFGDEEAQLLAAFGVVARPSFPSIVESFYARIREHEDAHAVFSGEAQIVRLQGSMVRWLTRLCGGTYDQQYFEETATIGRVHVKVGLPERYMFTAMALIRVALSEIADREMGADAQRVRAALVTLLDLELAIMLESYRENFVARLQHVERLEKAELGRSLARAEHRYKSAVELAHVIIIGLDARGHIQLFNGEAERVTGFGRDEAIGHVFVDLLIPEESRGADGGRIASALADAQLKGQDFEGVVRTRSGRIRVVRWQLAVAPSDTADEVVLFAIGQDTTEQVARADRTRQQEKLAAVGTLAAGLAHEIRNPLNGAQLHLAYLERSLKRSEAPHDLRDAVTVVADEIKRLATLVTEFLDFARPKPLETRSVSLRALCDRSLQLVAAQAAAQNIALHQDLPSQDVMLEGDPGKLEQVLLNLLHNAIEASSDGHGTAITLRARRQPRHIVLEVEDDGPGLVRPDSPVFDAFFSTKPAGTGLGLAITHRIVTDHAGAVDVDSRPGRTVFRVTLPIDGPPRSTMGRDGKGEA